MTSDGLRGMGRRRRRKRRKRRKDTKVMKRGKLVSLGMSKERFNYQLNCCSDNKRPKVKEEEEEDFF